MERTAQLTAERPAEAGDRRLTYQPALDGIRALAVLAVLAYHSGLSWARGGFLGVDAFFVLSGYLITSLLLAEWRSSGSIGLLAFWARRARRLLPALFLMLLGVVFYAVVFAHPTELDKIRGDALATIGYVANWRPIFLGQSYFDQFTMPSPLRHTWSLGIEEQYYIIWPLLFFFLLRVRKVSPGKLLAMTLVMAAASAILMGILFRPESDPSRVYYGTDTRAQSLLIGASLAMLLQRIGPVRGELSSQMLQIGGIQCAVALAFLWSTTSEDNNLLYRGGFLLLATAVAVVIAAAVQPKPGPLGRALSVLPLRALGLISYGVYLWHWPIYLMMTPARTGWGDEGLFLARLAVTLAIATASYFLIEMPIRRGAFRGRKVSWVLAPAGAVCVAIILVIATRGGISPTKAFLLSLNPMPVIDESANPQPIRVMVYGDSVAGSLWTGFNQVERQWGLSVWNRANLGCGLLKVDVEEDMNGKLQKSNAKRCVEWFEAWPEDLNAFDPDIVLMVFGAWDNRDRHVDGRVLVTGTPEWEAYFRDGLEKQIDRLSATGAKVMLATFPCGRPTQWSLQSDGAEREEEFLRRINLVNDVYRKFAEQHPEVILVELNRFTCPEGHYTDLYIDGVQMREDGLHFTDGEASKIAASWLAPQIVDAVITQWPQDPSN